MSRRVVRLGAHRRDWEDLASVDLYWSILSDPAKQHGGWVQQDYLDSGVAEVDARLARATELGHRLANRDALDFGCGAGRLTRALASRFERAVGIDIAAPMIAAAQRLCMDLENCRFVLNDEPDLRVFDDTSFDLVFTTIVLQHLPNRAAIRAYLREFVRVTRPGGLIVFQLPSDIPIRHRLQLRRRVYRLLRGVGVPVSTLYRTLGLQPIRMQFMPKTEVVSLLENCGARALAIDETPVGGIVSAVYYVTRP